MLRPLSAISVSARLSNLPTVWTPALVAAALASADASAPALKIAAAAAVLSMLYAAGMILNDLFDAAWDARHKPARPIPAGYLAARLAASSAGLLICAALAIATATSPTAAALAALLLACIVGYNWLHKRTPTAAVLMAACRALTYPLAAYLITDAPDRSPWTAAAAIGGYTLLLTLAARKEDDATARVSRPLAFALPLPVILIPMLYGPPATTWVGAAAGAFAALTLTAAWRARAGQIPRAVHTWLAAFCMADAYILACLGQTTLAAAAAICWLLTLIAHRLIPGT